MKTCANCFSKDLNPYNDTQEYEVNGKILVISNIPAIECSNCKTIYHGSEARQYIDKQIEIVEAEGFENRR